MSLSNLCIRRSRVVISTRLIFAALAAMVCSSPSQAIDVLGGATYGTPAGCVRHAPDAALNLMQADPSDRAVKVTDSGIDTADLACTFISAEPKGGSWKVETMCYQGDDETISDYLLTEDRVNGILMVDGDIGAFTLKRCASDAPSSDRGGARLYAVCDSGDGAANFLRRNATNADGSCGGTDETNDIGLRDIGLRAGFCRYGAPRVQA